MSAVSWYTRDGTEAKLRGPERALCASVVDGLTRMVVPINHIGSRSEHPLVRLTVEPHIREAFTLDPVSDGFTREVREWYQRRENNLRLYLGQTGSDWHIQWRPTGTSDLIKSHSWNLALNTAVASGSPIYSFMARLHATCEIHMWVAEENRQWLADLIAQALKNNILRWHIREGDDMGWGSVMDLLRGDNPGSVLTDFSISDSFANSPPEGWKDSGKGARDEEWSDVPWEERWDMCFPLLDATLEVSPESLANQGFGPDGYSWYDVVASPSWRED